MNFSPSEILVVLLVALIVFGPKRLPEVGRQIGGLMRELRRMQETVRSELQHALDEDPPRVEAAPASPPAELLEEPDHTDVAPPPPNPDASTDTRADERFHGEGGSFQ